eukprot:TRINITY_DN9738_c0_g1_i2.p1 TRINITY_DN9738_c0_g1~~TRINITY_DN9738_c0_g1_i2.p1  ORF type:complete len:718 (-),score=173.00 TRINITY_DN9738_c0_g1_i2:44-2197(-)
MASFSLEDADGLFANSNSDVHLSYGASQVESFVQTEKQLAYIRECLAKNQKLTDSMVNILTSSESRLEQLEKTITPIRTVTDKYRHVYENIEQTLSHVNKILDIFETGNKVEQKIKEGAKGDFEAYFKCLDNINEALTFIGKNRNFKNSTKVFAQLKVLRHMAMVECEQSFSNLITKNSIPIDPAKILSSNQKELIPGDQTELMKQLGKRLDQLQSTQYLQDYADKRARFLEGTIDKLGIDKMLDRNVQKDVGLQYTKGSHPYLRFIVVFVMLLEYEQFLTMTLIGPRFFNATFITVVQNSLEVFVDTGESVLKLKRTSDRLFGVFVLLDIWTTFKTHLKKFQEFLSIKSTDTTSTMPYNDVADLIDKLSVNCKKSFEEMEEFVVQKEEGRLSLSKHKSSIPEDGGIHELTSLTMGYLKRLLEYKDSVEELLATSTSSKTSNPSLPGQSPRGETKSYTKLSEFIEKVLKSLKASIEAKSKTEKKAVQLASIFLLNNIHYMLTSIRGSELLGFVDSTLLGSLEQAKDQSRSAYRQSWNKTIEYLMEINQVQTSKTKSFNSSEKSVIKSKFKGFNSAIEDLFYTQKHFLIPDIPLRKEVTGELKNLVVPLYAKFLERYGSLPFSKNRGKYVRYSTETLETLLDQFLSGLNTKRPLSSKAAAAQLNSPSSAPSAPVLSSSTSDAKHHHRTASTPLTAASSSLASSSDKRKSHRSSSKSDK